MWDYSNTDKNHENLYESLDLDRYLRPSSEDYRENRKQTEWMLTGIAAHGSIREYLNDLILDRPDFSEKTEKETVKLMTLHASKGLEFRHVFIIGVNNGLIPLNPGNEEEEEEERRLFFVGMTRAKESLELSYYTNPDGARVFPGPGRYLSFIPESLSDRRLAENRRDRKEAAEHLQNMKRMIIEERNRTSEAEVEESAGKRAGEAFQKRVSHPKYGQGTVLSEDENMITVKFDDYGEKELLKAFSQLEEI